MDSFDIEIKQIFLEEAQQLLDEAEGAFLALDAGDHSSAQIDKIFRLAHNFKGSAKAAGFEELSRFAHRTEDVLVRIRNGALHPEKHVCTALLKALDTLKAFVTGLKGDLGFAQDTTPLEGELEALQTDSAQAAISQPQQTVAAAPLAAVRAAPAPTSAPAATTPAAAVPQADDIVRVSTRKLDELLNLVGEMVVNQTVMNSHRVEGTTQSDLAVETLAYMSKLVFELQNTAMSLRMTPVKPLFQRMRRSLRDVSDAQGKEIDLRTEGEHVELDKTILEKITDPLNHLIRNAADHGVESRERRTEVGKAPVATVTLKAETQEDHVVITIADDGRGMDREVLIRKAVEKGIIPAGAVLSDPEAYALIFKPGFSTKEQVTDISGRGVGMDVVQRAVDDLKGSIQIRTELGRGTEFVISLPLSLSIITGMVISVDDRKYVVPVSQLVETIEYQKLKIETSMGKGRMVNLRGEVLPVHSLGRILHGAKGGTRRSGGDYSPGIVTQHGGRKFSFEIDAIVGQQQVVLKKLGPEMAGLPGVIAGAILANGEPGLILSLHDFVDERVSHAA